MTILVPIMLFGWVPLTIMFFCILSTRTAVLCSVIGGVLFLPMATYNLPGIPIYSKTTAIGLGLILGGFISGQRNNTPFRWSIYDLPMFFYCFVCPIVTSLSNGLGLYDGFSSLWSTFFRWGACYWAGRRYFGTFSSLRGISLGIVVGGLIYVLLCLFELRMSPQLSNIFYGFFPHSFSQHCRWGGYRPIVFMQHGLMVALWMALSFTVAFWLWRDKVIEHIKGVPMFFLVLSQFVVTIFCKSANGMIFLVVGSASYLYYKRNQSVRLLRFLLLVVPLYIISRLSGIFSSENVYSIVSVMFSPDRVHSLMARITQEDLFSLKAFDHPFFGWGGWDRGWPIDPYSGEKIIQAVDALWTIVLSENGFVGLISLYLAMLVGPWCILKGYTAIKDNSNCIDALVLSLVVIIFMIDSLVNAMVNPVYIMCAGALISCWLSLKENDNFKT